MSHFGKWFGRRHDRHASGHHGPRGRESGYPAAAPAIACPACRQGNDSGARFCQHCGSSLAPSRCGQCGREADAAARFCSQCGQVLR
ncbi:hypothetical protein DK842_12815 [Chromobacterium phragmitis]|uniref:zinc ribbon domain-containing protein n=1 Tax=Chromobacterium phragmitis TaxID=2202141 RepID=UPI000DECF4EB|nr:hypothetical protein DK842_12815 [Chromobacterium phragmitis]